MEQLLLQGHRSPRVWGKSTGIRVFMEVFGCCFYPGWDWSCPGSAAAPGFCPVAQGLGTKWFWEGGGDLGGIPEVKTCSSCSQ